MVEDLEAPTWSSSKWASISGLTSLNPLLIFPPLFWPCRRGVTEAERLEDHLATCTVCSERLRWLQPAVDLTTGAPTGVEALIRWRHPRRGALGPAEFVRAVEGSELVAGFTRYVIDKALAAAAEWAREGVAVPISVNVSARSLLDPRLPGDVAELLLRHQVPPHRLVLEITETVVMSEV